MNQKTYPVLYVQKIATRLYKHCGIYPTLYFKIEENEKLKDTPYYAQYMKKIEKIGLVIGIIILLYIKMMPSGIIV